MAIWQSEFGAVESAEADNGITGRWYKAAEPTGGAADYVVVVGIDLLAGGHIEAPEPALLVQCLDFGAVPAGWNASTEEFDPAEFYENYAPLTDAERAVLALAQVEKSRTADEEQRRSEIERQARWNAAVDRRAAQLKKNSGDLT